MWRLLRNVRTAAELKVKVGAITLLDFRDTAVVEHEAARAAFSEALKTVREVGDGFPELVESHLKEIVLWDDRIEAVVVGGARYGLPLNPVYRDNTTYLALRLVWAATFIRLQRNHPWWSRSYHRQRSRQAARKAQDRFVSRLPDAEEWVAYLDRHTE